MNDRRLIGVWKRKKLDPHSAFLTSHETRSSASNTLFTLEFTQKSLKTGVWGKASYAVVAIDALGCCFRWRQTSPFADEKDRVALARFSGASKLQLHHTDGAIEEYHRTKMSLPRLRR